MARIGKDFENLIESTFEPYRKAGVATLGMLPVPTVPLRHAVGHYPPGSLRKLSSKAPFDVYGWTTKEGRFAGAELKANAQQHTSLGIRGPTSPSATGIAYHQLYSLAELAKANGIARIVWSNGGEIRVLLESAILETWRIFDGAIKSEGSGRASLHGSKSISWNLFESVDHQNIGGSVIPNWLKIS